ncbi:MAG: hypothetical protein H6779_01080 [Candidatus Nomurabacteria bacterium]|nr:MAG: hypothetical protein H6779_01080 [Candidatus Nomurabacteria bacterium]
MFNEKVLIRLALWDNLGKDPQKILKYINSIIEKIEFNLAESPSFYPKGAGVNIKCFKLYFGLAGNRPLRQTDVLHHLNLKTCTREIGRKVSRAAKIITNEITRLTNFGEIPVQCIYLPRDVTSKLSRLKITTVESLREHLGNELKDLNIIGSSRLKQTKQKLACLDSLTN